VSEPDERGAVTAELAVALPVLVFVTLGLVWLLSLGVAKARMVDASREAARALARGDSADAAVAVAREVAPEGTTVSVADSGDRVTVSASWHPAGLGGLLDVLPAVELTADAVALREAPP
jgi:Flp pilus assembly protein TadG